MRISSGIGRGARWDTAAFCLSWLDPTGRYGQIEPTATHPDYQRHGLGRALLVERIEKFARNFQT